MMMYLIISFYKPNKKKSEKMMNYFLKPNTHRFVSFYHETAPGDSYKTYKCKCTMQVVCFLIFVEDIVQ